MMNFGCTCGAEALEGRGRFAQSHVIVDGHRYVRWIDMHRAFFPSPEEARSALPDAPASEPEPPDPRIPDDREEET